MHGAKISLIFLFSVFTVTSVTASNHPSGNIDGVAIPFNSTFPDANYPYPDAPNGCSVKTGLGSAVKSVYNERFTSACNQHDRCYMTAGESKSACDNRFLSDMRDTCKWWEAFCFGDAEIYASAVKYHSSATVSYDNYQAQTAEYHLAIQTQFDSDNDADGMTYFFEMKYGLNVSINDSSSDLDGDGLSNLDEFLLGSIPNKPDTDDDGINDGDEVALGRNPVVDELSTSLPDTYFSANGMDLGTRLADINGDGLTDIIQLFLPTNGYYGGVPQRRVYLYTGSIFEYNAIYSNSLSDTYFSAGGTDLGTRLADINNDGLTDIIQLFLPTNGYYGGVPQRRIFLNNGSQFVHDNVYSSSLTDTYFSANGTDLGTRLEDINGDGLTDITQLFLPTNGYYGGVPQRRIFLNNGTKFVHNVNYSASLTDTYFSANGTDLGTRLADINGDGLTDITQLFLPTNGYYGGIPQRRIYLNNGSQFVHSNAYSNSLTDTYFSANGTDLGTRLADINGDGLTDITQLFLPTNGYYGGVPQRRIFINNGSQFIHDVAYSSSLTDTYFSANGTDLGTRLADIDGDGLTDITQLFLPTNGYYGGVPQRRIFINDGARFAYHANYSSKLSDTYFSANGTDLGARLSDVNGDSTLEVIQLFLTTNGYYGGAPQRRVKIILTK